MGKSKNFTVICRIFHIFAHDCNSTRFSFKFVLTNLYSTPLIARFRNPPDVKASLVISSIQSHVHVGNEYVILHDISTFMDDGWLMSKIVVLTKNFCCIWLKSRATDILVTKKCKCNWAEIVSHYVWNVMFWSK